MWTPHSAQLSLKEAVKTCPPLPVMLESLPLSSVRGAGGKKWYAGMWGKEGFEMVLWDLAYL